MKNPTESYSNTLFSESDILPGVNLSIVIPVKDEEAYILKTLSSFLEQIDIYGKPFTYQQFEILILANNCSDQSVEIIKQFQLNHPHLNIYLEETTLSPQNANIGYVRRKLMESAYSRLSKNGGGIILTTDGDTMVASDWIAQTLDEINNGAEVVGGRILLSKDELDGLDEFTKLHHFKDEKYHLLISELEGKIINSAFDPNPRHHQHFNGSFAITTDCYARSGGVPKVDRLEDCAFFDRLEGVDSKIRHSHKVKVYTSARCIGRAEIGLSYQLNIWKNLGNHIDEYFVESGDSIFERLTQKRNLMKLWELKSENDLSFPEIIKEIVPNVIIDDKLINSFNNSRHFGELYRNLRGSTQKDSHEKFPAVPIDTAIKDLQTKIEQYSDYSFSHTSIL
jgi:glycosyltransferase involved in cell wall biosynthesis